VGEVEGVRRLAELEDEYAELAAEHAHGRYLAGAKDRADGPLGTRQDLALVIQASQVFGQGVEVVVATSGKPAIAYPNAGESWDADNHAWVGTSSYDLALVPAWRQAGAEHLGGCCRIGPATIAAPAALGS